MSSRTLIASISEERATVLLASLSRTSVDVEQSETFVIPEDLRSAEPHRMGGWLRNACDGAGIKATRVIFGESRHGSVAKLLSFDCVAEVEADLPGMVRLQMIRQLSFPADDAVIDFVVVGETSERIEVRAAAITRARVEWYEAIARGGKWKVQRIGLRTGGVAHA
ncbi:MAG: hypothetical protein KDA21_06280, partial [Phycisphaerales bacterium]|nr:hypothetical protein [Phycisphaerales bacterium]